MFSTYNAVEMVVDEAEEQSARLIVISKAKRDSLKSDCELIDHLVKEFDCESVTAEIDDDTLDLTVTISCYDMILEYGRTHPFFTLIQHTSSFGFRADGDMMNVYFTFTGLWSNGE